jgi:hypothetical protein
LAEIDVLKQLLRLQSQHTLSANVECLQDLESLLSTKCAMCLAVTSKAFTWVAQVILAGQQTVDSHVQDSHAPSPAAVLCWPLLLLHP